MSRVFQFALAVFGLVLVSPLILVVAIAIRLTSRGPVFYRGERVGKDEQVFRIYKFRTLTVDAEQSIGARLLKDEDRVYTPIGRILKKTKIDELPQLLNVLKGDMNFVGPRPIRPIFLSQANREIPNYPRRFEVRPGMTGLAQVYGGYWTDPRDKLRFEMLYIQSSSIGLDLKLIWLTLLKIFGRFVTTGAGLVVLFLFVSFFPTSLYPWLYMTIWGVKLNLLYVLMGIFGLWLVAKKTYNHRLYIYRSPIYLPMFGFAGVGLCAAVLSPELETAVRGTLYYMVTGFMLSLGFLNTKLNPRFVRSAASLVGVACGMLAVVGLIELAIVRHSVIAFSDATEIFGQGIRATFATASALSAYLVFGLPLLLCQLIHSKSRSGRDFWLVLATIVFVGILLTQDVFGLFGLFVTCAVFLTFTSSRTVPLVVCLFVTPLLLLNVWDDTLSANIIVQIQTQISQINDVFTEGSLKTALIGSGLKTQYSGPQLQDTANGLLSSGNMHLTLIQETGVVGWLFMLWIFWSVISVLYREARQGSDLYFCSIVWAILSSTLGFMITMCGFNVFLHPPLQILFWGLIGLGLGTATHIVGGRSSFYVVWRFGNDRPRTEKRSLTAANISVSRSRAGIEGAGGS